MNAVVVYRDDGPLSRWLGGFAAGQLPALLPALVGLGVTAILLFAGVARSSGFAIFAPAVALLLTGPASSHPHEGRLDWLVPPILRVTEYSFLAAVGFAHGVGPLVIFALLGALVFHHYDLVYRVRQRIPPPHWLPMATLGWDGRMLAVALAATAGIVPFAFAAGAVGLWAVFGWESATSWLAAPRGGRAIDLEEGA